MPKITEISIPERKIAALHRDFELLKHSKFRKMLLSARLHLNRLIQSTFILGSSPYLIKYAAYALVSTIFMKKTVLRSLEIAVTYRCNSRCQQCSCYLNYNPQKEESEKLNTEEIKRAIDEAVRMGAFQFVINGGEPLLEEKKVFALICYIKQYHHRYVHLCTNGTLLTEDKIAELKQNGLDSLEMGFDSAFPVIHDQNRIEGSYAKIIDNVAHCKKYGIRVILNTVLTNEKVKSVDIIYTMRLAKKLGCMLQITPCCITGRYKDRLDMMLTEESKLYFLWLLSKTWNNRSDLYSSLTKIKCPAAREKIGLQPYGDVVSCPLIQISYGNIRQKSIREIQKIMLQNHFYLSDNRQCLPSMNENFIKEYLLSNER